MQLKNQWSMILIFPLLLAPPGIAEPSASPVFNYNVEADLVYIDRLENLRATNSLQRSAADRPRTLGLSKMRMAFNWEIMNESRLNVILRPDASLRQSEDDNPRGNEQEFDSRAGRVYFQPAKISLLDAYQLTKTFSEGFEIGVGVYEELTKRQSSYKPILEFGLFVPLPQKFSALHVKWQSFDDSLPQAQAEPPNGYGVDFYIIQGDRDRGEIRGYDDESYDRAPSGRDPQYGAALGFSSLLGTYGEVGLIIGMADTDMRALKREEGEIKKDENIGNVKRNEVYSQLYGVTTFEKLVFPIKVAADVRVLKEKFKTDVNTNIDSAQFYSVSLTTSMRFADRYWLLVGGHLGKNQVRDDAYMYGHQLDIGYMQILAKALTMTILTSQEVRKDEDDKGVFGSKDSRDSTLHRIAFELRYNI